MGRRPMVFFIYWRGALTYVNNIRARVRVSLGLGQGCYYLHLLSKVFHYFYANSVKFLLNSLHLFCLYRPSRSVKVPVIFYFPFLFIVTGYNIWLLHNQDLNKQLCPLTHLKQYCTNRNKPRTSPERNAVCNAVTEFPVNGENGIKYFHQQQGPRQRGKPRKWKWLCRLHLFVQQFFLHSHLSETFRP